MSVEDQLSSIDQIYQKAYDMLDKIHLAGNYSDYRREYWSSDYISEAIKNVVLFQRMIELLYEETRKLADEKTEFYVDRCGNNIIRIRLYIRGSGAALGTCGNIDLEEYDDALRDFTRIRSFMYGFAEDVRMIYALRIYPIEEKMALKSILTDFGFLDVAKCLEEGEENLATKHFKDCIDRSREALEKTVSSILTAEKKKSSDYFSTDIGTLSGMGLVDKETKRLTEATYSYLSEVGAHGRGEKLTPADAHYAMKETYMRIDILLKKYSAFLASKK